MPALSDGLLRRMEVQVAWENSQVCLPCTMPRSITWATPLGVVCHAAMCIVQCVSCRHVHRTVCAMQYVCYMHCGTTYMPVAQSTVSQPYQHDGLTINRTSMMDLPSTVPAWAYHQPYQHDGLTMGH